MSDSDIILFIVEFILYDMNLLIVPNVMIISSIICQQFIQQRFGS